VPASAAFDRGLGAEGVDDYQTAIADYSEAIRLKPDFELAYSGRAYCYNALGNTLAAKRDREKADKLEKGSR
jgi:tetratricopeptide (TPR) repeat protein